MKMSDATKRIIEVYNQALKEQGGKLELGTSKADGLFRYAVYEPKKQGQTRRTMVASGPDIKSLFLQVGASYGIDVWALENRAQELWKNIFYGC